jgi:hypothetical protein
VGLCHRMCDCIMSWLGSMYAQLVVGVGVMVCVGSIGCLLYN